MIGLGLFFIFVISYFDDGLAPDIFNTAKIAK
jgi:hypothetical protein